MIADATRTCPACGQPLLTGEAHCPACRIVRPYVPRSTGTRAYMLITDEPSLSGPIGATACTTARLEIAGRAVTLDIGSGPELIDRGYAARLLRTWRRWIRWCPDQRITRYDA